MEDRDLDLDLDDRNSTNLIMSLILGFSHEDGGWPYTIATQFLGQLNVHCTSVAVINGSNNRSSLSSVACHFVGDMSVAWYRFRLEPRVTD